MRSPKFHGGGERGSITVFFIFFILVLFAALGYSVLIGRTAEQKMTVETAADTASLAMANHAAMGLNTLATNNLAVGASLHVAAAVPFVGRYYALIRAYLVTIPDGVEVVKLHDQHVADKTPFASGFDATKSLTGHFVKTAAGLTAVNLQIAKHWDRAAVVKGIEQMRLNAPGSVGMPMQVSKAANVADLAQFYNYRFEGLALSDAAETMCHTIRSSEVLGHGRNRVSFWLGGVLDTIPPEVPGSGIVKGVVQVVQVVEGAVQTIGDVMSYAATPLNITLDLLSVPCLADPLGLVEPCNQLKEIKDELKALADPPMPRFDGCGLNYSGDFGFSFKNFTGDTEGKKHEIGFVFPSFAPDRLKAFEDSLQYAAVVGSPLYLSEELPATSGCPADWQFEANGRRYCSLLVGGINLGAVGPEDLAKTARDTPGAKGALRGVWSRTQWSLAQAKAEYEPESGQDDPTGASSLLVPPTDPATRTARRKMQLFWPAWRGRNAEPTVVATVLRMLGNG